MISHLTHVDLNVHVLELVVSRHLSHMVTRPRMQFFFSFFSSKLSENGNIQRVRAPVLTENLFPGSVFTLIFLLKEARS